MTHCIPRLWQAQQKLVESYSCLFEPYGAVCAINF